MTIISKLKEWINKSSSNKGEKTCENVKSESRIFFERDNIGTRILTADRNQAAYNTWVANGSKPIGSIYFAFKTKEDAYKAMLDIPCIKLAKDSKELICTEIIEFGVYWDSYNNKHWEAFLQGNSLTKSTFDEAEKSFVKHNGKKITANEPPVKKSVESNSRSNRPKIEKAEVEFIKYLYPQMMGITCTKEIYKATNKSIAIEFLKSKNISKQYYYIEIETPDGWVGKDIDGVYET